LIKGSSKEFLLEQIIDISNQAAEKILEIYYSQLNHISFDEDHFPTTAADHAAHDIIFSKLSNLTPEVPIVSEEGDVQKVDTPEFWLVDPLDGTKEFIQRNGEFTVNIALIQNGIPILGVVCAPTLQLTYAGIVGERAFKIALNNPPKLIQVNLRMDNGIIVVGSRSHSNSSYENKFLSLFPNNQLIKVGSSLKFCLIAEGVAHIYPRFGRTMEWDTAAGQAVLMAAGGLVTSPQGIILTYGKEGFENPHFIALASNDLLERVQNGN
jgi:3'(2'), 5'-bisphosphate nucleotidase